MGEAVAQANSTTARDRLGVWLRFYVGRSLALDKETARLSHWSARARRHFLASKTRALPRLQMGRTASVRAGDITFRATSPLDLGSFQSCLADVHDMIVVPRVLKGSAAPVVVDVGANVGQFALALKAFVPDGRILSIEPDPQTFAKLADNLACVPDAKAVCAAVGDRRGVLPLHRHDVSLMATLRPSEVETYDPEDTVEVDVLPLDALTADLPQIDLLKIDVEGYEREALLGATDTLRRTRHLLIEIGLGRDIAGSNLEVLALVREAVPTARIVRFGRPLGSTGDPICQDVLIALAD